MDIFTITRSLRAYNYQLIYATNPMYRSLNIKNHPIKNLLDYGYYAQDFSLLYYSEMLESTFYEFGFK